MDEMNSNLVNGQVNAGQENVDPKNISQEELLQEDVISDENRQLIVGDETSVPKMLLWERKLLDFSLRNNLLNLRVRSKVVQIATTDIGKLEDVLQDGATLTSTLWEEVKEDETTDEKLTAKGDKQTTKTRKLKFCAMDEAGVVDSCTLTDEQKADVADNLKKKRVMAYLDDDDLQGALKSLYRAARTAIEENGANSLYMVIGMLRWKELGNKDKWRYAPILLLPVEITRSVGGKYTLRMLDEDVILNTTLVELMRQQYQMDFSMLNPLPMDEHGIDVKRVMDTVRQVIEPQKEWSVVEEAVLGLFSFSKFVMWNDIHTSSAKMLCNPIIQSLVTGKNMVTSAQSDEAVDARQIDKKLQPHTFAVPLDVDSSQLEAVVESGEGKSFILHGPPGTGKSQTITNMIANALWKGKRVLFVAEKMAALSVVQKRLEKVGLGPFCLEMHSNKATKTHLLAQLDRALEVGHRVQTDQFAQRSQQLFDQRQQLIAYMEALHTRSSRNLSVYDCISEWLTLEGEEMPVSAHLLESIDRERLNQIDMLMEGVDTVMCSVGHPADHPLLQLNVTDTSLSAADTLQPHLEHFLSSVQTIVQHGGSHILFGNLPQLLNAYKALADSSTQLSQMANLQTLKEDGTALLNERKMIDDKWFGARFFARKKLLKRLKKAGANVQWEQVDELANRVLTYDKTSKAYNNLLPVFGITTSDMATVSDLWTTYTQHLSADIQQQTLAQVVESVKTWLANLDKIHAWSIWCTKKMECKANGLEEVIDFLLKNHKTGRETARALRKNAMRRIALQGIDANPSLQTFNGLIFEQLIEKYRALAKEFQTLTKEELYYKLASRIPSLTMEAASSSEMGILKRSIKSKARGMTIRALIDHIPTLLPRLCPCMLMSPLSVAQYLDLDSEPFDIVVFDEASQMPTSEAVGAIARGRVLVVVGDPMQMPPTSFFSTTNVGEDDVEIDDMESILDDCITLSLPSRYLTWHYRSKHESLITFSNAQYYDSRLLTFPSVDDRMSKVQFVPVDGVYDMGKTRCNRAEADAIVNEVIRRLSDPELRQRSIGVVSFSKVQQSLIEDVLVSRLAEKPELEALAYDSEEPIFIKNLENVQGDERDVILFSVGYGPDKDGKVSMNFGPLNNSGGERRLNVAVSRARYEMMIFSSMRPEQIDLNRTQAEGVKGLKKFLEFAQSGRGISGNAGVPGNSGSPSMSGQSESSEPLAQTIARELQRRGHQVDTSVGRSRFKIDIAVLDPDTNTYRLGILCDGKNYFETKTQRDREIVQPSVLNMLGWNIMRVWSVDWFLNRDEVLKRIEQQLKQPEEQSEEQSGDQPINKVTTPLPRREGQGGGSALQGREPVSIPYMPAMLLPSTTGIMGIEAHPAKVKQQLQRIVKAEQPITFSLLCRRIASLWNATNSPRLQKNIRLFMGDFYMDPLTMIDNPYFWTDAQASENYINYRTDSNRDIADIPLIEICNAMHYAVEQQIAVPIEDLQKQTAKMLGFSRTTDRVNTYLRQALDHLQSTGAIQVDATTVKLP